jgi:hypothetical protein
VTLSAQLLLIRNQPPRSSKAREHQQRGMASQRFAANCWILDA